MLETETAAVARPASPRSGLASPAASPAALGRRDRRLEAGRSAHAQALGRARPCLLGGPGHGTGPALWVPPLLLMVMRRGRRSCCRVQDAWTQSFHTTLAGVAAAAGNVAQVVWNLWLQASCTRQPEGQPLLTLATTWRRRRPPQPRCAQEAAPRNGSLPAAAQYEPTVPTVLPAALMVPQPAKPQQDAATPAIVPVRAGVPAEDDPSQGVLASAHSPVGRLRPLPTGLCASAGAFCPPSAVGTGCASGRHTWGQHAADARASDCTCGVARRGLGGALSSASRQLGLVGVKGTCRRCL